MFFEFEGIKAAELLEPVIITEEGGKYTPPFDGFSVNDSCEKTGEGIFRITRTIVNTGKTARGIKSVINVRDCFAASRYLIPCILYNGNEHGSSNTPKSLEIDGEPWVFAYDRTGIPSCTLTENDSCACALFADASSRDSLVSSCSLRKTESGYVHSVIHPVTESPYTYSSKNVMTGRYDTYRTLEPGESVSFSVYVFVCRPEIKNYAAGKLLDACLDVLDPHLEPCLTEDRVFDLGVEFAKALLYEYRGRKLIITHFAQRLFRYQHSVKITLEQMAEMMKDPYYTELGRFDERFEIGWADQNLLNARMLAVRALETGDNALLDVACGVFDAFVSTQKDNGLLYTLYEQNFSDTAPKTAKPDACNLGWGAAEGVRMYFLLKKHGIEKPEYLEFSERICGFFASHMSPEYCFGKSYHMDGSPAETAGSVGGFMITAMMECYNATKDRKYLDCAIKAHDFYYARDLDNFVCTAGALDCASIDKETAYPFVTSSLMLYDVTGDSKYIERARKAAYYFISWMFFYDVLYENGSEFTEYGYHTTGGTAISAEHHAIDPWGAVIKPELYRLAEITGENKWRRYADLMWANAVQGITSDKTMKIHGIVRPLGGQNEGFFQARWTKYRPTCEDRGHFNDCLPAWTGAYRMYTVYRIRNGSYT